MNILLIEDDAILGESLREYLGINGMNTDWLADEHEFEEQLIAITYDAIILDLTLRNIRGEDILKRIRGKDIQTPILILTAKTHISTKEICFNLGADDYLSKPFELKELILRLRALSKKRHVGNIITIGDVKIDIDSGEVYKEGHDVGLSRRAWDLLYLLLKHRGETVGNEAIMNYVWADNPVGDEIIRTYIKNLRRILPDGAIINQKGRGYKLNI